MPLDAFFAAELCGELKSALVGAKIDKVRQPEKDSVVFVLRGNGATRKLLVCFSGSSGRVCLTEQEYENPAQPPMFCMLLRKHLVGARILDITQPSLERLLEFRLLCYNDFGESEEKRLVVELLGRNANLILVDGAGRITDAARRVDSEMSPLRQVLPGLLYHYPPRPPEGKFSGLSPLIAREMESRGLPAVPDTVRALEKRPYLLTINGEPKDFSFLPIYQYGPGSDNEAYASYSELLEAFYAGRDRVNHIRSHGKSMAKLVRGARNRTEKKLALRQQELRACADRETYKKRGDLITANLWRMKKGQAELCCEDYYEESCPEIRIPLDALKTPQQNAALNYRLYTKKKAAEEHLLGLIEENSLELEYLRSVEEELGRAETLQDLKDIRAELEKTGYIRVKKNEKKKEKPSGPMSFTAPSGLSVTAGRNNIQNDTLTFSTARRSDLWFHALKYHGSHVILHCGDTEPTAEDIAFAAAIAARYSEAAGEKRIPVDYTRVRNVKKIHGTGPGMVTYTGQTTVLADGSADSAG